jgi:hypothetical protein
MTDETTVTPRSTRVLKQDRPSIELPDGDFLDPRIVWAHGVGISDDAAKGLGLETVYIGGVAYIRRNQSLQTLADRAKRRNEPPARRHRIVLRR